MDLEELFSDKKLVLIGGIILFVIIMVVCTAIFLFGIGFFSVLTAR